jgi:1,4-alpha-glucan branching enzyme
MEAYIMEVYQSSKLRCVNFHIKAEPGRDVYVSGSFNHWNGRAKKMTDEKNTGDYYIMFMLPPGDHEYKFVIDGEYRVDPECPRSVLNDFGTLNSVIHVE